MAKLSMIQKELKKQKLVIKYLSKRKELKSIILNKQKTNDEKWDAQIKLQKLPINSAPTRLKNRCQITGRAKSVYKKFGLGRNKLREHAMLGDIPGLKKASW